MKRSRSTRLSLGLVLVAALLTGVSSASAGVGEATPVPDVPRAPTGCTIVVYAGPVSVCL